VARPKLLKLTVNSVYPLLAEWVFLWEYKMGKNRHIVNLHNLLNEARVLGGLRQCRDRESNIAESQKMGVDETRRELAERIQLSLYSIYACAEELLPGFDVEKFLKQTKVWGERGSVFEMSDFLPMLDKILPRLCGWCGCITDIPHMGFDYPDPLDKLIDPEKVKNAFKPKNELTQKQAAYLLGKSIRTIRRYEHGRTKPKSGGKWPGLGNLKEFVTFAEKYHEGREAKKAGRK